MGELKHQGRLDPALLTPYVAGLVRRRIAGRGALAGPEREQLQARLGAGESDRAELTRLRQERKDVLSQVNAMLKEMEKLQL